MEILAKEYSYSQTLDGSPVLRKVVLFTKAHRLGKDSHRVLREEWDTHLATQLSQSEPHEPQGTQITQLSDQRDDSFNSQIALTSDCGG